MAPAFLMVAGAVLAACAPVSSSQSPSTSASPPSATATAAPGAAPQAPPGDLLGLDETALKRWFGTPSLIRRDYPAEVWQYRAKACVLELYLYPADDHMEVADAEARPGEAQSADAGKADLAPCLSALVEANRKSAQS